MRMPVEGDDVFSLGNVAEGDNVLGMVGAPTGGGGSCRGPLQSVVCALAGGLKCPNELCRMPSEDFREETMMAARRGLQAACQAS